MKKVIYALAVVLLATGCHKADYLEDIERLERSLDSLERAIDARADSAAHPAIIHLPDFSITFCGNDVALRAGQSAAVTYHINEEAELSARSDNGWNVTIEAATATEGTLTVTAPVPYRECDIIIAVSGREGFCNTVPLVMGPVMQSDLSANGTANCYIVSKAGEYSFDATVIGNGEKGLFDGELHTDDAGIAPASARILLCQNNVIKDVAYNDGRISFVATGLRGNAVIAACGTAGETLWSWHIWCTDYPSEYSHTNLTGRKFTLLDRNLGAVTCNDADWSESYGMVYQWGRKDPFVPSEEWSGSYLKNPSSSIEYSVSHPAEPLISAENSNDWGSESNRYLWGNYLRTSHMEASMICKTIYDPCPPGYQVAPSDTWSGVTAEIISTGEYGLFYQSEEGPSFYPAVRYLTYGDVADYTRLMSIFLVELWTSRTEKIGNKYDGGSSTRMISILDSESKMATGYYLDEKTDAKEKRNYAFPVRCSKEIYNYDE